MPYISSETLYTDKNPGDTKWNGKVLSEGDAEARFILYGKGSVFSDQEAGFYGLAEHKSVSKYDAAKAAREREEAVIQRSKELAAGVPQSTASEPVGAQDGEQSVPVLNEPKAPAKAATKSRK